MKSIATLIYRLCYKGHHLEKAANQKKLHKWFQLSRSYYFYSALLIGYPRENAKKPTRRRNGDFIIVKY